MTDRSDERSETFTDEEVARILDRAVEQQTRAEHRGLPGGRDGPEGAGTSLAELEKIAEDAGIDPRHVRSAALEVRRRPPSSAAGFAGVPDEFIVERSLPAPVGPAEWEELVMAFREAFGVDGIVTDFGDVREWASANSTREAMPVRIRVETEKDGARISIRRYTKPARTYATLGPMLLMLFAMVIAIGGAADGFATSAMWAALGFAGAGIVSMGPSFLITQAWAHAQRERFDSVVDRAQLIVGRDA